MRGIRTGVQYLRWLAMGVRRVLLANRRPRAAVGALPGAALGLRVAARGKRARALFSSTSLPVPGAADDHVDLVVADTRREAAGVDVPTIVLADAPARLSVPAVEPRRDNPIGWVRNVESGAVSLGPRPWLPEHAGVRREASPDERGVLRRCHHVEDVAAFHDDSRERAGTLARLAARGVPVHLADGGEDVREMLGAELHAAMTTDMRRLGLGARERLSIRMRRCALRDHSVEARVRQLHAGVLDDRPLLPRISILAATRRPALLGRLLASVARQSYPRLELVLCLHDHDGGFPDERPPGGDALPFPVTVLRPRPELPLGSMLNAAADAARGTVLVKMDDDDLYGPDHVWDLWLARTYSGAGLVAKGIETIYLRERRVTVRYGLGGAETYRSLNLSGAAMLVSREALEAAGGWRQVTHREDHALAEDVERRGYGVYRTHASGFVVVRHSASHSWKVGDSYFLGRAEAVHDGFRPDLADLVPSADEWRAMGAAPPVAENSARGRETAVSGRPN